MHVYTKICATVNKDRCDCSDGKKIEEVDSYLYLDKWSKDHDYKK